MAGVERKEFYTISNAFLYFLKPFKLFEVDNTYDITTKPTNLPPLSSTYAHKIILRIILKLSNILFRTFKSTWICIKNRSLWRQQRICSDNCALHLRLLSVSLSVMYFLNLLNPFSPCPCQRNEHMLTSLPFHITYWYWTHSSRGKFLCNFGKLKTI